MLVILRKNVPPAAIFPAPTGNLKLFSSANIVVSLLMPTSMQAEIFGKITWTLNAIQAALLSTSAS